MPYVMPDRARFIVLYVTRLTSSRAEQHGQGGHGLGQTRIFTGGRYTVGDLLLQLLEGRRMNGKEDIDVY